MNTVKKEEEPTEYGFSATRLGMEKTIEKERFRTAIPSPQGKPSQPEKPR